MTIYIPVWFLKAIVFIWAGGVLYLAVVVSFAAFSIAKDHKNFHA